MGKIINFKYYEEKKKLKEMKEIFLDMDTIIFYKELENIEKDRKAKKK